MRDEEMLEALFDAAREGGERDWLRLTAWCYAAAWEGRMFEAVPLRGAEGEPRGSSFPEVLRELAEWPTRTPGERHLLCLQVLRAMDAHLADEAPGFVTRVALPAGGRLAGTVEIRREWSVMRDRRREFGPPGSGPMRYDTLPSDALGHVSFYWDQAPRRALLLHEREQEADGALLRAEALYSRLDPRAHRVALCPLVGAAPRFVTRRSAPNGPHDHFHATDDAPVPTSIVDDLLDAAEQADVGVVILPELGVRATPEDLRRWRGRARMLVPGSWHVGEGAERVNRASVVAGRILWHHHKSGEFRLQRGQVRRPLFPDAPDPSELAPDVEERVRRGRELRTMPAAVWGRFGVAVCADVLSENGVQDCLKDAQHRVHTLFIPSLSPETDGFLRFAMDAALDGMSVFYVNNGVVLTGTDGTVVLAFASLAFGDREHPPLVRWCGSDGAPQPFVEGWDWKAKRWKRLPDNAAYRVDPRLGLVVDIAPIRRSGLTAE